MFPFERVQARGLMTAITKTASHLPGLTTGFSAVLLTVAVYGCAVSLLFGWGMVPIFLYVGAAGILARLFLTPRQFTIDRPMALLLALVVVIVVQGYLMSPYPTDLRFLKHLSWPLAAVAGATMLPERLGGRLQLTHSPVVAVLVLLYVVAQWVAFSVYPDAFGLFSNLHFPALYCVLTLPILLYFAVAVGGPWRWVFILASLGDMLLLLKTQSRPGFLALTASALALVPLLSGRQRRVVLAAVLAVPVLLFVTGVYGFDARMADLFGNLTREERVAIWTETLALQSASSGPEWVFGHGFGAFLQDYQTVSSFHGIVDFSFPHNFLLEWLYSHGVVGLVLLVAAYSLFLAKLAVHTAKSVDPDRRRFGMLLIAVTTAHLTHSFFTLPFFSKSTLYPLSLVLGVGLRFLKDRRADG